MRMKLLRKNSFLFIAAVMACMLFPRANATDLSGNVGADNGVYIYLSTSQNKLGTLIDTINNWVNNNPISPVALTPGTTYYINVEAYNVGGPGGFIGSFSLSDASYAFSNGTQSLDTGAVGWLGGYNSALPTGVTTAPSGPPAAWVTPNAAITTEGLNGVSPWGTVPGVSTNAQWIWPSDSQSYSAGAPCQYCWVDFSSTAITPVVSAQSASVPAPLGASLFGIALLGISVLRRKQLLHQDWCG